MNYTKGKWSVESLIGDTIIVSECKYIANVKYADYGTGDPRNIDMEEHKANAALISAAPDVIEALLAVKYWLKKNNIKTLHDRLIDAAIKKATTT